MNEVFCFNNYIPHINPIGISSIIKRNKDKKLLVLLKLF